LSSNLYQPLVDVGVAVAVLTVLGVTTRFQLRLGLKWNDDEEDDGEDDNDDDDDDDVVVVVDDDDVLSLATKICTQHDIDMRSDSKVA
jgi:hypothetical protein